MLRHDVGGVRSAWDAGWSYLVVLSAARSTVILVTEKKCDDSIGCFFNLSIMSPKFRSSSIQALTWGRYNV